jgi:hypothetical protein
MGEFCETNLAVLLAITQRIALGPTFQFLLKTRSVKSASVLLGFAAARSCLDLGFGLDAALRRARAFIISVARAMLG